MVSTSAGTISADRVAERSGPLEARPRVQPEPEARGTDACHGSPVAAPARGSPWEPSGLGAATRPRTVARRTRPRPNDGDEHARRGSQPGYRRPAAPVHGQDRGEGRPTKLTRNRTTRRPGTQETRRPRRKELVRTVGGQRARAFFVVGHHEKHRESTRPRSRGRSAAPDRRRRIRLSGPTAAARI